MTRRQTGCIYRNLRPNKSFHGRQPANRKELLELSLSEAIRINSRLQGTKVHSEHDRSIDVGRVVRSWFQPSTTSVSASASDGTATDTDQDWMVELEFHDDPDDVAAGLVWDWVSSGLVSGLSLSHDSHTLQPMEVSVCWNGARPGTRLGSATDADAESVQQSIGHHIINASAAHWQATDPVASVTVIYTPVAAGRSLTGSSLSAVPRGYSKNGQGTPLSFCSCPMYVLSPRDSLHSTQLLATTVCLDPVCLIL